MAIHLDSIDLIIAGDYGVLTSTPFKDYQPLHMLPGRAEFLAWIQEDRHKRGLPELHLAVAGNKGGVAWGKHTEAQGEEELRQTAEWIGTKHYAVCFGYPTCAVGFERYTTPEMLSRRKPSPVMFRELAEAVGVPLPRVLIVDHYQDGYEASKVLGCGYVAPSRFFAGAANYIRVSEEDLVHELDLFDIDAALSRQAEEEEE